MATMITGGTGFLGSYLARHLVQEKGDTDLVLYDMYPTMSRVADIQDRVTIVQGDVLEPQELLAAMQRHDVDRVVHLAFILGGSGNHKEVPYLRVQCMGTANVFEACRIHGVKRVVYASSVAVYGGNPKRRASQPYPLDERREAAHGAGVSGQLHHGDGDGPLPEHGPRPGRPAAGGSGLRPCQAGSASCVAARLPTPTLRPWNRYSWA